MTEKKKVRSGVRVSIRGRSISMRSFGPDAPDLRDVVPGLLDGTRGSVEDDCRTCGGEGQLRDGASGEMRRCLDCAGSGEA